MAPSTIRSPSMTAARSDVCRALLFLALIFSAPAGALAGPQNDRDEKAEAPAKTVPVPRLSTPPQLENFLEMAPTGGTAAMARISNFIQNQPKDGEPATQKTDAYLGYDEKHLYVVFVCFDSEPGKVRA